MTKKRLNRRRRPEAVLSDELRKIFETGRDFFGYFRPRLSDAELREKLHKPWQLHQKMFMKEWLSDFDHLGMRPHAWWQFSCPGTELRRCIAGWLPIEGSPIWMGYRHHWVDKRTVVEPEVFYLDRHGLLTSAELRIVTVLREKAVTELEKKSRLRGCPDPSTWNWDGMQQDWNGKGAPNAAT